MKFATDEYPSSAKDLEETPFARRQGVGLGIVKAGES